MRVMQIAALFVMLMPLRSYINQVGTYPMNLLNALARRRLVLTSITKTGAVYIWAYVIGQNWDVFAPGFKSLPRNVEYVESETEFDLDAAVTDGAAGDSDEPAEVRNCSIS